MHDELDDSTGQFDLLEDGLRSRAEVGVMPGAVDHLADFFGRKIHVADDFVRRCLAVTSRTDGGRTAACGIAAGIHTFE